MGGVDISPVRLAVRLFDEDGAQFGGEKGVLCILTRAVMSKCLE